MPRMPRFPAMTKRLKRSDSLLALLAFILAALVMAYCGGDTSALRLVQGEEAIAPGTAQEALLPSVHAEGIPEAGEPVRFMMHNVANYFVPGERQRSRYTLTPKPVDAREAVADIIAHVRPELVGLTEIGGPLALADLRQRLEKRGLHYPYYRVLVRMGDDRALAILSHHPIVQDNSRANKPLHGEHRRRMLRGVLDVTVQLEDGRLFRIIGAHLKSRVTDDPAKATALRTKEAYTLALHIQEAIRRHPKMPILVYGDWNDGPADASLGVLRQGLSRESALSRLSLKDSRGDGWTIFYEPGQSYNTFDQLYVNKVLRRRIGKAVTGGVVDIPATHAASDHRALWCELR